LLFQWLPCQAGWCQLLTVHFSFRKITGSLDCLRQALFSPPPASPSLLSCWQILASQPPLPCRVSVFSVFLHRLPDRPPPLEIPKFGNPLVRFYSPFKVFLPRVSWRRCNACPVKRDVIRPPFSSPDKFARVPTPVNFVPLPPQWDRKPVPAVFEPTRPGFDFIFFFFSFSPTPPLSSPTYAELPNFGESPVRPLVISPSPFH